MLFAGWWVYGFMGLWVYGFMRLGVYGFVALWLYAFLGLWVPEIYDLHMPRASLTTCLLTHTHSYSFILIQTHPVYSVLG